MIQLVEQHREAIVGLCHRYQVKRLELFGSAARGNFRPTESDIDFLVEFVSYETSTIADQWFGLQEDLETLLGCRVDLTSARTAKNPHFLEVAGRSKVTLYAA